MRQFAFKIRIKGFFEYMVKWPTTLDLFWVANICKGLGRIIVSEVIPRLGWWGIGFATTMANSDI